MGKLPKLSRASSFHVALTLAMAMLWVTVGLPVFILLEVHLHWSKTRGAGKRESSGRNLDPSSYWGKVFASLDDGGVGLAKKVTKRWWRKRSEKRA